MNKRLALLALLWLCCGARDAFCADPPTDAKEADAKGFEFFETKIRPVLVQHCYKCHSVSGKKSEGSLLLDSRAAIRKGGDRGPAVVPGKPDESWLLTAILQTDADLKMPPKKERLPKEVLNDFTTWIRMGAPDPREESPAQSGPVDLATGRKFWSLQKPTAHAPPTVKNDTWPKRKLDHFVLAKLEAAGLSPTADAEPARLLRRLHFDLVGLPPSPAAIKSFLAAVEKDGLDATLPILK